MGEAADFIHLRVHTAYSLLEGAIKIKMEEKESKFAFVKDNLVGMCEQFRMPAVAMTDTNNLFGAFEMSQACASHGIQPIIGEQAYVDLGVDEHRMGSVKDVCRPDSLVLLVQNDVGYDNLRKLSKIAYMDTQAPAEPHVDFDALKKHSEGLICLTGGLSGTVDRLIVDGKKDLAKAALQKLAEIFPDRLYIELQRHGIVQEKIAEETLVAWAYEMNLPLVATNEAFFTTRDVYEAHDALICISEKTYVDVTDRRRLTPEHYFKSPQEMKELFSDLPEAIENTVQIAKRCGFMVEFQPPALPHYNCGKRGEEPADEAQKAAARKEMEDLIRCYFSETTDKKTGEPVSVEQQLAQRTFGELAEAVTVQERARTGLEKRLEAHVYTPEMTDEEKKAERQKFVDRLEYELGVIVRMKFPGYFLIVSDFIQWSKANGIPVGPGRGSGAGSVVAWSLTITDLNPLRFSLLFERFLNPERVNMPDFDVDFCQDRRGETIAYMQRTYGFDSVAQIITFGKLNAKAVVRDVGRVIGLPYPVVDRISKLIPDDVGIWLKQAFEQSPDLLQQAKQDDKIQRLLDLAVKLEGLYRNASTHAAGLVVGQTALDEIVPIYRDPSSDMPVTQYNMKFVESTGLVKFDFLGLKTLTVIQETVKLLKNRGIDIDMSSIPLDDRPTFDLLQDARTDGVFQLESSGMKKVLRDLVPDVFEDLIAVISLYRPGPMDNIPSYIARKKGAEKPDYMHPSLEGILKETYGIMIYQEQVMQIAQKMAGYTMGGADELRKVMGKKQKEKIPAQREKFTTGAVKNGVDPDLAKSIFDRMEAFASYGFNKSHAAAYALVTYQTAYLKAHYPVEFMAATMTYESGNTDKLAQFKQEVVRMKIDLLPPDVNAAQTRFSVQDGKIRYALSAIKGVGAAAMDALVEEREKNGKFKSLSDFIRRLDTSKINRKCVENMIKAGALDSLDARRGVLFENLDVLMAYASAALEERNSAQISLFAGAPAQNEIKLEKATDWSQLERTENEAQVIGFFLSAHPLDVYADSLRRVRAETYAEVCKSVEIAGSKRAKMAAIVTKVRERISDKNNRYAFVTATDSTGTFDFGCWSENLARYKEMLNSGKPLLVTVDAERRDEEKIPRLSLRRAQYLDEIVAMTSGGVEILLDDNVDLTKIADILKDVKRGTSVLRFVVRQGNWEADIAFNDNVTLTPEILSSLRKVSGVLEVREV